MTEKLARRGLRVGLGYRVDALDTATVAQVMTRDVVTVPASAGVGDARRAARRSGHSAFPVVSGATPQPGAGTAGDAPTGGRPLVVGLVSRSDLFADVPDDLPVTSVASSDVVTVRPDATALEALGLMLEEGVDHLPVLDGGRLAGICTRTDLLSVRRRHFDEERRQPGWRPRLLR